jgi:uncharacterized DUF497 family protein
MEFSGFDWDEGNRAKCREHGVPIEIIEGLFRRGLTILPDEAHSQAERRFAPLAVRSRDGRSSWSSRFASGQQVS